MRRKSSKISVTDDTPTKGSSQTHKTKIDDSSTPAEAEQMNDLPKPKVATAEEHRLYASICTMEEVLFAPMTSHISVLGAPNGATVVNNFHAGEVRTNLGKTLKKFAEAVVSLFNEGPLSMVDFASSWSQTLAETCPRYTFELQGLGPLFSFMFFHCVTAQAKFEASEGRIKALESQLAAACADHVGTLNAETQTDDLHAGDVDAERTPQKPQASSVAGEQGWAEATPNAAPSQTLDTTPAAPAAPTAAAAAVVDDASNPLSQPVVGPSKPAGEKPGKSTPRGSQRQEAAVESMLRNKKQHRLVPMSSPGYEQKAPATADAATGGGGGPSSMMMIVSSKSVGGQPHKVLRSTKIEAAAPTGSNLPKPSGLLRPATVSNPQASCNPDEEADNSDGNNTTKLSTPFASVNGLAWKEFWSMKEKKKMQQKLGLTEPPVDFSNRDAAEYGHQIIKMKDEFLGTTAPLTARVIRPTQGLIESRPEGMSQECP